MFTRLWWFRFDVDAWRSSVAVRTMSDQQRGWYISLLVEQWAAGGKLRNDPDILWVLAGAGSKAEFDKNSASVMAKFPLIQNQRFRANRRMLADATSCQALAEQNRAAGKLSAKLQKERKLGTNARSTPVQRPFNEKSTELELELKLESHPNSKKEKSTTTPSAPTPGASVEASFDAFWIAYPSRRRSGKIEARAQWLKIPASERPAILAGLEAWKLSKEWRDEDGRWIPMPAKFLRDQRWVSPPPPQKLDRVRTEARAGENPYGRGPDSRRK